MSIRKRPNCERDWLLIFFERNDAVSVEGEGRHLATLGRERACYCQSTKI
jgi:hypothetical protein